MKIKKRNKKIMKLFKVKENNEEEKKKMKNKNRFI